jgi:hypothetical protein
MTPKLSEKQIQILLDYWLETHRHLPVEPKQKKLVELKFWINENGWCWFHSELKEASWKEIPYTIKDGKIFIEVE